jgi:hypothetical protein
LHILRDVVGSLGQAGDGGIKVHDVRLGHDDDETIVGIMIDKL